nr:histone-lysine n-methyltransferase prdm9 [Quercus suber]
MSVPPSRSNWHSVYPLENTLYDNTASYPVPIGGIDQLPARPTPFPYENGAQNAPQITLNSTYDDSCAWDDEGLPFAGYSTSTIDQDIGPLPYTHDDILWQNTGDQNYVGLPQAHSYGTEAVYDTNDHLHSQRGVLGSASQVNHLNPAAAPSPPDSQCLTPFKYQIQNEAMIAPYELATTIFASTTRAPASLPPSTTPEPGSSAHKRKRSVSDTSVPVATSRAPHTPMQHSSGTKRPKLGLSMKHSQAGQCLNNPGNEMCQCCNHERSKVAYATPSPQGPTSAPAEWLNGMSGNINWQLVQSTLGPGINNWNRDVRLPGEGYGAAAASSSSNNNNDSNNYLQLPITPMAAPSPSASSVTSSARTLTKRNRDEMTQGAYRCTWDNCGKGFPTSNDLSHHQRYHASGRRPHICETCGKDFLHRKDMRRHQNTHETGSASKRHFCAEEMCRGKKGYSRKDHLARHMRTKHAGGR